MPSGEPHGRSYRLRVWHVTSTGSSLEHQASLHSAAREHCRFAGVAARPCFVLMETGPPHRAPGLMTSRPLSAAGPEHLSHTYRRTSP
jgi:hypothetical protein